jgi:hypothetical protein
MRQIDRSKTCVTVGDLASLQKTLEQIAATGGLCQEQCSRTEGVA